MANILPRPKQIAILRTLVEGVSVRATERLVGVSRETVLSLLVRVGNGCKLLLDDTMRNLPCKQIEVDEAWGYVGKKQRHVRPGDDRQNVGDTWVYVALCADTKIVPAYLVGKRNGFNTNLFVADLARRLKNRPQISSDGLKLYVEAIELAFGSEVDYAQVVKSYEAEPTGPGRYSPPKVIETEKTVIMGAPDPDRISTSYVERQNLTMRMHIRRLTRLTNAFSKKIENHRAAVALHFAHYNFARVHQTLRASPAMAAGVSQTLWGMDDLLDAALGGMRP